jgi:SAM-dependent methyltransferase
MLKPAADAMLAGIEWHDGMSILDVASGTGEPGLTAASLVSAKGGNVLATDLSEEMTAIAREAGRARHLTNFRAETASADQIPAPDNTFDVILCRFGFMFFPNIAAVLVEFTRVLKPGGRLVAAVWSAPPKNAWATTAMSVIRANVDLPPPQPGAPGLFRFADDSSLVEDFKQAGLRHVHSREIEWKAAYGQPQDYWSFVTEVSAPVVDGLSKATPEARARIHAEVITAAERNMSDGEVRLSCASHILSAVK